MEQKRQYLPVNFNPLNLKDVQKIIEKLLNTRLNHFRLAKEWFGLFHELSCTISESHTILELKVAQNQNNKRYEKDLIHFENEILSELLNCRQKMMDIYLNSPFKHAMHNFEDGRISKELQLRKQFSIPEISNLQIEESAIIRKYKSFHNSAKTLFEERIVPISTLVGKQFHLDAEIRKQSFLSYWSFIKENEKEYQNIFDELLTNRRKQAQIAGCEKYTQIAFAELGKFDYSEQDCAKFRGSILKEVVPLLAKLTPIQAKSLNYNKNDCLSFLKPWDLNIFPDLTPSTPPLNKKATMENLLDTLENVFRKIHPSFADIFNEMIKNNLIDVLPKNEKSAGAFTVIFHESGHPFLFGNFGVNLRDILTFIHEFGHCIHGYALCCIQNILLRQPGLEFCEFASIGLEFLASPFFQDFWGSEVEGKKALKYHLFQVLRFWPFMAMLDEWQHELYGAKEFLTAGKRNELWNHLSDKYCPNIDWSACPEFKKLGWLSRPHVFTSPFYFIDYGIAQTGALQLWSLSKQNYSQAVQNYINSLCLGSQVSLQELFSTAGIQFDLDHQNISKLCLTIEQEIFS